MTHTTAIIPALNEAPTVGAVVRTASASPLVDDLIVVDGGSTDGTQGIAERAGARLIEVQGGKGEGMTAGARATQADVIVFLDADLYGLSTGHVDRLVRSVETGGAAMACGLFDRGPLQNLFFYYFMPFLTGERAVRRDLFLALEDSDVRGYRAEAALNSLAAQRRLPVAAFIATGMGHRLKEDKEATRLRGSIAKVQMIVTAVGGYVSYWLRRRSPWRTAGETGTVAEPHAQAGRSPA